MKPDGPSFTRKLFWRLAHSVTTTHCSQCGAPGIASPENKPNVLCQECRQSRFRKAVIDGLKHHPPQQRET